MSRADELQAKLKKLQAYNEPFFGDLSFRARLRNHPFIVPFVAVGRRTLGFFINRLKVLPEFFRVKLFFGDTMLVPMPAGFVIWWFGFLEGWELPLATFMVNNVHEGDTFFDIGANDGYFTILGAHFVGNSGRTYGFEPSPSSYNRIKSYIGDRPNITLVQKALFNKTGSAQFLDLGVVNRGGSSSLLIDQTLHNRPELGSLGGQNIDVQTIALDDYLAGKDVKPSFLQIDTEGTEFEILQGAAKTLAASHPIVAVEVLGATEQSGKYAEMANFMKSLGYTANNLTKAGGVYPVANDKPESGTIIFTPAALL